MAFDLPQRRIAPKQIQLTKRNVPLDQIIAVQGQNPVATGIETGGNVIGQALLKRAELRRQGEQIAQLAALSGEQAPTENSLTPELYEKALALKSTHEAKISQAAKDRVNLELAFEKLKTGYSEYDPLTGKRNDYPGVQGSQISYDTAGNPIYSRGPDYQAGSIPKSMGGGSSSGGTLVQSGLFDKDGQPIMVNNKTGQSQTIPLPNGTVGTTQTKTQLTPTSQTRSTGEFASTMIPHIKDLKDQIAVADQAGFIGPLGGRYQAFMTGKVGSTGDKNADYMLGKLKTTRDLLATGTMKTHVGARGGGELLEHFLADMDTGRQSAAVLQGELDALIPYMEGYQNAGRGLRTMESPKPTALPVLTGAKKSLADKLGL